MGSDGRAVSGEVPSAKVPSTLDISVVHDPYPFFISVARIPWAPARTALPHDGGMIPNITRGSNPAGLVRYLFGPGRRNEHRDQHLVCASSDMLASFGLDGRPVESYEAIGRALDRRYRGRQRAHDAFPPDRRGRYNPGKEPGFERIWHCSLSIPAAHGPLPDQEWEDIVTDYLMRMGILRSRDDESASWVAVRHGLSANGNDHVHIVVQLARDDDWHKPYRDYRRAQQACREIERTHADLEELGRRRPLHDVAYQYSQWRRWAEWKACHDWVKSHGAAWEELDGHGREHYLAQWEDLPQRTRRGLINGVATSTMPRMHVARIVEACAIASDTEDEFIRRIRRAGLQIDPFLRKGTSRDAFRSPEQVTGYRITWASSDGWRERLSTRELGDDFRLRELRARWRHDPHEDALAVLEWKAAMENRAPAIGDGAERRTENLTTQDLARIVDVAFKQVMLVRSAAPAEMRGVIRAAIREFDDLRAMYGEPSVPPSLGPVPDSVHNGRGLA